MVGDNDGKGTLHGYIPMMLLKSKEPPDMYETLKKWNTYHINWWSPDFWTINSMPKLKSPNRGRNPSTAIEE